jgi:hypothetical protein
MVAFNNDPVLKQKCLDLIVEYGFLKGIDNKHIPAPSDPEKDRPPFFETELGLPEWLFIFEFPMEVHLPDDLAKSWVFDYFNAIPVGADLSRVVLALNHWMLTDPLYGEWRYFTENNRETGCQIISLYSNELYGSNRSEAFDSKKNDSEWFEVWCQTKNPIQLSDPMYWIDAAKKEGKDRYYFHSYTQKPIGERPSVLFERYRKEGNELHTKFVLSVRERVLSLLMNAKNI